MSCQIVNNEYFPHEMDKTPLSGLQRWNCVHVATRCAKEAYRICNSVMDAFSIHPRIPTQAMHKGLL